MELQNKVALITGGSGGIGFAIARRFAQEGAATTICDVSDIGLETATKALQAEGLEVHCARLDVSASEEVNRCMADLLARFGRIDALVTCAGIQGPIGRAEENDPELWRKTIEVNLLGTYYCIRAALPVMMQQGGGKIVTFSGGGATGPRERFSAYAASKTAVVRLTETIAEELKGGRIDINAIAPGAVNTNMLTELLAAGDSAGKELEEGRKRAMSGGTPPDKAADLAVFLASSASDGISGKLLSAVWDPYRDADFIHALKTQPDLATLRRIDSKNFIRA